MDDALLDRITLAVAVLLVLWLIGGRQWNRRRAVELARAARDALRLLGDEINMQSLGGGTGGFLMEVGRPGPGIRSAQLLCLLEPRDFPLAWAWTRWRGRRDQFILKIEATQPLRTARLQGYGRPAAGFGLRRLVLAATQPSSPQVQVSFGVAPGEESDIARAVALAAGLARGELQLAARDSA
ncbi:hypothetical protein Tmar_2252 [Thermaerobacter marianensis DSM 12885]|uniref:Uncharacterized protein n=1 Tax=Thermaerobacter marianensis (strain ATCC 700841 / DSM 12885 / JCM 10246 / 7p75a) TaxID=644966 RepID=E6SKV7_THEM7|nr:hypothetical protein [Thermaerobacter marianensis]ADU52330.1 hypothetical protein Tmar_2252 [Thermaerobacter marianensis DSM 12885]